MAGANALSLDLPQFQTPVAGLVLYHTAGCHLCELADALVVPLAHAAGVRLERIDIADSECLLERYGTRIPVLCGSGEHAAEIGWPFDAEAVRRLLAALSGTFPHPPGPVPR